MCDCIKKVKDRIQNEMPIKNPEYANLEINDVDCDGEAFVFTEKGMVLGLSIPFTAYHQPIRRKTKTTVNMIAKFCPFCGQPYEKGGGI